MTRIRISTTVDSDAITAARALELGSDAVTIDAALKALLANHRSEEIDAAYAAYDSQPLDAPDAWGDLAAFRVSIATQRKPQKRRAL